MTLQHDPRAHHRIVPPPPVYGAPLEQMPVFEQLSVVTCSLCLRVLRDGVWIEAEEAIRELRSYESPVPIPLESGLCDECSDRVRARRAA